MPGGELSVTDFELVECVVNKSFSLHWKGIWMRSLCFISALRLSLLIHASTIEAVLCPASRAKLKSPRMRWMRYAGVVVSVVEVRVVTVLLVDVFVVEVSVLVVNVIVPLVVVLMVDEVVVLDVDVVLRVDVVVVVVVVVAVEEVIVLVVVVVLV